MDGDFGIRPMFEEDRVELRLFGDLDVWTAPQLADLLKRLLVEVPTSVVVDLGRLRFIDTNGLCVLVRAHRQFQGEGGELILVNALRGVRRAMDITGVSALLSVVE